MPIEGFVILLLFSFRTMSRLALRGEMLISHNDAQEIDGLSRSTRERLVELELYPSPGLQIIETPICR